VRDAGTRSPVSVGQRKESWPYNAEHVRSPGKIYPMAGIRLTGLRCQRTCGAWTESDPMK
jgi:hypothetical protein